MDKNVLSNLVNKSFNEVKKTVKEKLPGNIQQDSNTQNPNDFQPQNNYQNNVNIPNSNNFPKSGTYQYPNFNQNYQNPMPGYFANNSYGNYQQWNYSNNTQYYQKPQFIQTRCPQCGANLVVENGIDTFYCQYCGNRVILMNPNKDSLNANVKIKKMAHREKITDKILGHFEREREMKRIEEEKRRIEQEKKRKEDQKFSIFILIGVVIFQIALLIFIYHMDDAGKKDGIAEENRLQSVLEQIYTDMANLDYDAAMIKANSLYYTAPYNQKENIEKWNGIRSSTIDNIKKAQQNQPELPVSETSAAEPVIQVTEQIKNNSLIGGEQTITSAIAADYQTSATDSIPDISTSEPMVDVDAWISAPNPYLDLPDLEVSTRTKFSHAFGGDSTIIQGNNETFEVIIETHNAEATFDDVSVLFDESEFQVVNINDLYNKPGDFSVEMQCIAEGNHYVMVFANYDLYEYEDEAMGFEIPVRKLSLYDGQVVYVSTYTGEKYHSTSTHAGENWTATTLLDAEAAGYEPCKVCY